MCGLTVIVVKKDFELNEDFNSKLRRSLHNISHRGPDASGIVNIGPVYLGHCRLSIIDLNSRSDQPMVCENSNYYIAFNGEIYNYRELKARLTNWKFRTESDTEVVLAAYAEWGAECFSKFVGQFSVAIYDRRVNKLVFARDMMGEKPLFIHRNRQGVFLSSEIKGLMPFMIRSPVINHSAFNDYMHYQYVPEPGSIIEDVSKLEAGSVMTLDVTTLSSSIERYWNWRRVELDQTDQTEEDIKDCLRKSVELALVADVPVALGLSAGLDSTAIALYAKDLGRELSTFTIGYAGSPAYDERDGASSIAKYLNLHNFQVEVDENDFADKFDHYCSSLSEPIADIAGYGHYLVANTIAKAGHKVMLSGIGGDELFWGYEWTRLAIKFEEMIKIDVPETLVKKLCRAPLMLSVIFKMSRSTKTPETIRQILRLLYTALVRTTPTEQTMYMGISGAPEFTSQVDVGKGYYPSSEWTSQLDDVYRHTENFTDGKSIKSIIIDLLAKLNRTWLISNCVQLSDSVSMANGIESRAPFLNPQLVKTMLSYNVQNRMDAKGSKFLLRRILSNRLPESIVNRPKSGFVPPVGKWIQSLEDEYGEAINNGELVKRNYIRPNFFDGKKSSNVTLHTKYRVILLERWYSSLVRKN
jgi:asparagine synthase (glutamine-hydrolysing)